MVFYPFLGPNLPLGEAQHFKGFRLLLAGFGVSLIAIFFFLFFLIIVGVCVLGLIVQVKNIFWFVTSFVLIFMISVLLVVYLAFFLKQAHFFPCLVWFFGSRFESLIQCIFFLSSVFLDGCFPFACLCLVLRLFLLRYKGIASHNGNDTC